MTEAEQVTKYLVCDGCGYAISAKAHGYLILTVNRLGEPSEDLHFHLPEPRNSEMQAKRSWGTADCLGYWHVSRKARDVSTGTDGVGGLAWKNRLREMEKEASA